MTSPSTALFGEAGGQAISVISDPFKNDCLTSVWMHFTNGGWGGWVEFRNGNTLGKQQAPECRTFDELLAAMRTIADSVKNK